MKRIDRRLRGLVAPLLFSLAAMGAVSSALAQETGKTPQTLRTIQDLENARIGVTLGSASEEYLLKNFPNAKILQFKASADVVLALKSGKVDAMVIAYDTARLRIQDDSALGWLAPAVMKSGMAAGFNPQAGDALRKSFDAFVRQLEFDGTLQDMKARWFHLRKHDKVPIPNPNPKGELRIGVTSAKGMPSISLTGEEPLGFDIELSERFAAYMGLTPKFVDVDIPGLTAAVATGKVDFAGGVLAPTEERRRRMAFSSPIYPLEWSVIALASRLPPRPTLVTVDDLAGKDLGLMTGTVFDRWAQQRLPAARLQRFNATADMILALNAGKVDAVLTDSDNAKAVLRATPGLGVLAEDLFSGPVGAIFRKEDPALRQKFNAWLARAKADGTTEKIHRRWRVDDPQKAVMPTQPPAPAGARAIRVAVAVGDVPWVAERSGRLVGHDIEIIEAFAAAEGLKVAFSTMEFAALVTSVSSGKHDMGLYAISINAERAKQIAFSDPYATVSTTMLARKKDLKSPAPQANDALSPATASGKGSPVFTSVKDVETARIALTLGSAFDDYARKELPKATVLQFKTGADVILALKSGKADVAFQGYETARDLVKSDPALGMLSPRVFRSPLAFGFNYETGAELRTSFNAFLAQVKADGTLDDMKGRWLYGGKLDKVRIPVPNPKGELRIGVTSAKGMPLISMTGKEPLGFDIELGERFAAYLGRTPRFFDLDIPTMIASLASNKIDLIGSTLAITEERAKRVAFSDQIYPLDTALVALASRLPPPPRLQSIDDLAGKHVGLMTGTIYDRWAQQRLPSATLHRYNAQPDITLALHSGKLDAAIYDAEGAKAVLRVVPGLGVLDDDLIKTPIGVAFRKQDPALRAKFNAWLAKAKQDGTYEAIRKRWLEGDPERAEMPRQPSAPPGARVVRLAVSVGDMPWAAEKQGRYIGHDIEMIEAFAAAQGFRVEIASMDFSGLVAALASGKADMAADAISITAERSKLVDFSEPYTVLGAYMLARQQDLARGAAPAPGQAGPAPAAKEDSVWDRIHANLVHEDRWKLIADGLGVTAIISVMSTIFGTLLGAVVCWMRMSRNTLLSRSAGVYIWLLRGLPVLVLLMIIYYIVFASVEVNPVLVASVAFGLNMAAYSAEMFRTGIEGVDRGQTEAGIAGGFTRAQAFLLIVMPQALRQVLPVYKGEVISMVKMTSVVGYVAVQDLTKASDIIRSRTFDAFVPLIATAIIYLAIAWLVAYLLDKVEWRITPKHKRAGAAR